MKRGLIAAGAVAMLLLTGCTSGEGETDAAPEQSSSERAAEPTAAVTSPSPAAATPVEVSATPEAPTKATAVLTAIQLTVASYGVEVMADQIKTASDYACDQLASGASEDSIVALTGDIPEGANRDLVQLAASDYCSIR
ncbi:hypothetical protein AB0870_08410 [Microbacterium proteolyticum]|uniref:hypothetical protein n=1 Tax=Microbacterium proteolyticum TaxID=1572644 RepID=UPI00345C524D